jgi:hypothetical protein
MTSPPPEPTAAPDAGAEFLALAQGKGLIDADLARAVADESAATGRPPSEVLLARGILTEHLVATLERERARARGPRVIGGYQIIGELGQLR